jgi:hypothetical protein
MYNGSIGEYIGDELTYCGYRCVVVTRHVVNPLLSIFRPPICEPVDLVDLSFACSGIPDILFVEANGEFVTFRENVQSTLQRIGDDVRVILPKRTSYFGIVRNGLFYFIDYVDKRKTFSERRAIMYRHDLPVVEVFNFCQSDIMIPVIPSSIFVNSGFFVRRDILYGLVEVRPGGEVPMISMVVGQVSHCGMHGFVEDDRGVICVFDHSVQLPRSDSRSVKSAYNLTIGLNYWVIPEINNVIITKKVCDGYCQKYLFDDVCLHRSVDQLIAYGND